MKCSRCKRICEDVKFKRCQRCRDNSRKYKRNKRVEVKEGFRRCSCCIGMKEISKFDDGCKTCIECLEKDRQRRIVKRTRDKDEDERVCSECLNLKDNKDFKGNNKTCIECRNMGTQRHLNKLRAEVKEGHCICQKCAKMKPVDEFTHDSKQCNYCHGVRNTYLKRRYDNDDEYRILISLRGRSYQAIKHKLSSTKILLGCDVEFLIKWLYHQLELRYGIDKQDDDVKYHIDHFMPCSSFDLKDDKEEQKKCFHWSNLQWLSSEDNLVKGDEVPGEDEILARKAAIDAFINISK